MPTVTFNMIQYNGKENVANKVSGTQSASTWQSLSYVTGYELYNYTNPLDWEIVSDRNFRGSGSGQWKNANYMWYQFDDFLSGGIKWYAWVDSWASSDGIWHFKPRIDPLATAWYAGCFNSEQYIEYSKIPSYNKYNKQDNRISFDPVYHREKIQLSDTLPAYNRVLFGVIKPLTVYRNAGTYPICDEAGGTIQWYIMSLPSFHTVMKNFATWTAERMNFFGSDLFKIYLISDQDVVQSQINSSYETVLADGGQTVNGFEMYALSQGGNDGRYTSIAIYKKTDFPDDAAEVYAYKYFSTSTKYDANDLLRPRSRKDDYQITPIVLNTSYMQAAYYVHCPDVGDIEFTIDQLDENDLTDTDGQLKIKKIGFEKFYNINEGTCKACLRINGQTYRDIYALGRLGCQLPVFSKTFVDNYREMWASAVTGAAQLGASIAAGAYVNNMQQKAIGESAMKTSLVQGLGKYGENINPDGTISGATLGRIYAEGSYNRDLALASYQDTTQRTAVQLTINKSVDLIGNAASYAIQNQKGKANDPGRVQGGISSYTDQWECQLPTLYIIRQECDEDSMRAKFGYPIRRVLNVENACKGFTQTRWCILPVKGLPISIIQVAQEISDGGFYIN